MAYSATSRVFSFETNDGFRMVRASAKSQWEEKEVGVAARQPSLGTDWVVLNEGAERTVLDLETGRSVPIPVGARDARPKAWMSGCGVTWIDGLQVYRFKAGDKPRLVATLPAKPTDWQTGPAGAAVFSTDKGDFGLGPKGSLQELPPIDPETIRFSDDGNEWMAVSPEGVVRYSLETRGTLNSIHGRLVPVGFGEEPVLLDEDSGVLKTWSGSVLGTGFSPSAVCQHGTRLYGPGGTAWDMTTGEQCWDEAPLAATHIVANQGGVIQVSDRIEGFDDNGAIAFNIPLPIDSELDGEILDVHWIDGFLFFEVEDGWVQVDFDGRRIGQEPPPVLPELSLSLPPGWTFDEELGLLSKDGVSFPMVIDGVAIAQDSRLLAWSEDGALYLMGSPPQP